MNIELIRIIAALGIKPKLAKIYLTLLAEGEGTVQEIAKASGIKRTTLYPLLEELTALGFILHTEQKGHASYVAEDPAKILSLFKKRIEVFERHVGPLEGLRPISKNHPRVFFFDGASGFKKIWDTIFSSGITEYSIAVDPREFLGFVREGYITSQIIREKIKRGIRSRQLVAFSEYAKEVVAKDEKENRISKMLPHIYKFPCTIILFGNHVAVIPPVAENMMLIIESDSCARTFASFFDLVWSLLPEHKMPHNAGV